MTDREPAEMKLSAPKRSAWRNLSAIWIVPLGALIVTLFLAWQNYAGRGTMVTITFPHASGVIAGETTLRYRDVVIGTVERVGFTEDLSLVKVDVLIDKEVVPFLDSDAQFWVVRPQVSTSGISGLSTVLSGVYIEGDWDQVPGVATRLFAGQDQPPLVRPGERGKRIVLRTDDGTTIQAGAPILYRGVRVGQLEKPRLTATGDIILVDAFVEAPHDRLVTSASRFWDASGFTVSFGTSGFELDVDSIASLLSGGISFNTIHADGSPVEAGQVFDIYPSEADARRRPFLTPDANLVRVTVIFDQSVSGLYNGADVTYRGLPVGQVRALRSELVRSEFGQVLRLKADLSIDPQRIGLPAEIPNDEFYAFLASAVEGGLRAQLVSNSLFGGDLAVELAEIPNAEPAEFLADAQPHPILPTIASDVPDIASTAQGVLNRIDALPVEALMNQAISVMNAIEEVARDDGTMATPGAILALVEEARGLVGSEDTQAIPVELRATIADLRAVVNDLRAQDAARILTGALERVDQAAADFSLMSEGVPELLTDLRTLAQKANGLPIEELVTSASDAMARADALLADAATQAIPARITSALEGVDQAVADARAIMATVTAEGAVEALASALKSADRAAGQIDTATEGLPELLADLRSLAQKANTLPVEELVTSATQVMRNADTLLAAEETQALPATLSRAFEGVDAAVGDARAVMAQLREAGAVDALTSALTSADAAASQVATATEGLPELLADLRAVAAKANALPLEDLVASTSRVMASADTLFASDTTQALPANLTTALDTVDGALTDARGIMAELRQEGAVAALTSALKSADAAAAQLDTATEGLPQLVDDLGAVAAKANALPVEDLVARAARVLESADAFVSSDSTQRLPDALSGALRQVEAALSELRAGGTVENVNRTLESTRGAADAVARAAADLPRLTARLNQLVRQSEALLATYGDRSAFNNETLGALRDISAAAKSVSRLAREIERNPNSLLFGR